MKSDFERERQAVTWLRTEFKKCFYDGVAAGAKEERADTWATIRFHDGKAAGAKDERAAIVAWLRKYWPAGDIHYDIGDAIERGDHSL